MSKPMDIDLPDVVAEVTAAFERYERALMVNDVATLNSLFRDDQRTIRYGGGENLYGHVAISGFRAARSPLGLARTLSKTASGAFRHWAAMSCWSIRNIRRGSTSTRKAPARW